MNFVGSVADHIADELLGGVVLLFQNAAVFERQSVHRKIVGF